jgi:hypothetical protein
MAQVPEFAEESFPAVARWRQKRELHPTQKRSSAANCSPVCVQRLDAAVCVRVSASSVIINDYAAGISKKYLRRSSGDFPTYFNDDAQSRYAKLH